mmetsp:Transcript_4579/g.18307  ORF Transcript_4579/g.18307 Transcript_4579/m.18307 type:complete len:258 (+) Transcript_4579:378-1151(+)
MAEIPEIRVDVERHAVVGDPATRADADSGNLVLARVQRCGVSFRFFFRRRDFSVLRHPRAAGGRLRFVLLYVFVVSHVRPRAGEPLDAPRVPHAEVLHGQDRHLLQRAHVPVQVGAAPVEVEDGVQHDLARAVVGGLAAALGAVHLERRRGVLGVELQVVGCAPRAERHHRGVLHQQQAIARAQGKRLVGLGFVGGRRVLRFVSVPLGAQRREPRVQDGLLPPPCHGVRGQVVAHVVQVARPGRGADAREGIAGRGR